MDVLRVGRIGLYALTPDGSSPKMWDVQTHEWNALSRGKAASIREGLKMARELTAVNLLELPMPAATGEVPAAGRSEEHTSALQSLMRTSYAVFCLTKKKNN